MEKADFSRIINEQKESEERERRINDQKTQSFVRHKNDVQLQIQSNSEIKKQQRQDYLEEGRRVRMAQADEILKLETIKQNKLAMLGTIGISSKYQAELQKKKIAIW